MNERNEESMPNNEQKKVSDGRQMKDVKLSDQYKSRQQQRSLIISISSI